MAKNTHSKMTLAGGSAAATPLVIDRDLLVKDFISTNLEDFILVADPLLYAAIDWAVQPIHLEQELHNFLKGKFRRAGKRRLTDKLIKVRLTVGGQVVLIIHIEFEHRSRKNFPKRMVEYRSLAFLRYNIEDIADFALFTGAAPPDSHTKYQRLTFATKFIYEYTSIVPAKLDEKVLALSSNPVNLGLLALKYTWLSEKNERLRLDFKTNLFRLAAAQKMPREKMLGLLTFVRDLMHLPPREENEFRANIKTKFFTAMPALTLPTQGSKDFAMDIYQHVFGDKPWERLQNLEMEMQKKELEMKKVQAQREKEHRLLVQAFIKSGSTPKEIAKTMHWTITYVKTLLKESEKAQK